MRGAGISVRPSEAGMTLIEMMIVLVIIGVMAGAVALGMGSVTRAPSVETEARRLATRLQAAADDAMLGDRTIAFTVKKDGYGFAVMQADGQIVPKTDDAYGFHRLPGGMVMTLSVKPPVVLGVDGAGKPMQAVIESGQKRWTVVYDGMTDLARDEAAGFSLIEALVALAVLAIATVGLMRTVESHIDSTRAMERRTVAMWVAENRMAELQANAPGSDQVEMMGQQWRVSVDRRRTDDPEIERVRVEVFAGAEKSTLASLDGFVDGRKL